MKRLAASLVGAFAFVASVPAVAAWTVVASTDDYFVEFNPDLIRPSGQYTLAWTRMTYTVPQATEVGSGPKYQSQQQLYAVDCTAATSAVVGTVLYAGALGRGNIIDRKTQPRAQWVLQRVPSGSVGELTVRLTCAAVAAQKSQ